MAVTFYTPSSAEAADQGTSAADDCDTNNCFYCTSPETD
jgi:hypothetical protein